MDFEKMKSQVVLLMKKSVIIIFLFLIFVLSSCSKSATKVSLNRLPDDYSLDEVKADNCVVFEDSDITYGQSLWDDFIKVTEDDNSATVRLAFYYALGGPSIYSDKNYEK